MREGHATIQSRNGSTVPLTLFGLTKTFTCVQLSNTYLSATLTTATFPTAATCRGFDVSACTPTPRDLLSSHWQLRLHLIRKVANPLYIDVHLVAHGQVRWFVSNESVVPVPMVPLIIYEKHCYFTICLRPLRMTIPLAFAPTFRPEILYVALLCFASLLSSSTLFIAVTSSAVCVLKR